MLYKICTLPHTLHTPVRAAPQTHLEMASFFIFITKDTPQQISSFSLLVAMAIWHGYSMYGFQVLSQSARLSEFQALI